ncbi:MAG TPA: zf-HC2 domain-containing protein [Labilithrix sp.]|jgi:hypothetical protein|nr:zf-HC2 domain-containing protein [Labilithrix sp.]
MTLRRTRREDCVSDLALDGLVGGALSPAEVATIEAHLASCARCAERADVVRSSQLAFPKDLPPEIEAYARRHPEPRRRGWRQWAPQAVGALAIAALAILFVRTRSPDVVPSSERIKGRPHVTFHVQHEGLVRQGTDGDRLMPGDAIEFSYTTHDGGYLAVFSVDGASRVSVYYADGDHAARITPGVDIVLPHSTVLDETLGEETIHALFCQRPLAIAPVRAALEAEPSRAPAAEGCTVDQHRFVKERR